MTGSVVRFLDLTNTRDAAKRVICMENHTHARNGRGGWRGGGGPSKITTTTKGNRKLLMPIAARKVQEDTFH